MQDEQNATIYVDHHALAGKPLFVGSFVEASETVWAMKALTRIYARIETPGGRYDSARLEAMRGERLRG